MKRAEEKLEKSEKLLKSGVVSESNNFKYAKSNLREETEYNSRLFAIDAGHDADKLLEKYSDQNHFIIVLGEIKMSRYYDEKITGYISRINVDNIHVPLKFRKPFDLILEKKRPYKSRSPRYKVKLAFGRRLEPWIQSVQPYK